MKRVRIRLIHPPHPRSVVKKYKFEIPLDRAVRLAKKRILDHRRDLRVNNKLKPHFIPVLPEEVEKMLASFKRNADSSKKLYQTIGDRRRPLRSKMYMRYALSKVANNKIRAIRNDIRQLSKNIKMDRAAKKYNHFDSVAELEKAIPNLVMFSQKMEELINLFERTVSIRQDYFSSSGKGARVNRIVEDLDRELDKWRRVRKKYLRMSRGGRPLFSDITTWKEQIARTKESLVDVQRKQYEFDQKSRLHDIDSARVAEAELLNALQHFYASRTSQFHMEYKMFRLYGILLKGRDPESIRENIKIERKLAKVADDKLKKLFD